MFILQGLYYFGLATKAFNTQTIKLSKYDIMNI